MRTVNIREAKAQFSKLIEAVAQGEKIVIEMADRPVAMLLPVQDYKLTRKPGAMKGKIKIVVDFDAHLSGDLQAGFEGR
jgi:prevent-host-death family protein